MVVGQTGEYTDVLVIGGGPGGYSAAIRAAQLGRSVTLVERDRLGGICLNDGCIPSKALLSAAALFARVRDAGAMGIDAEPRLDFARLQAWKAGIVERLSGGVSELLRRSGVTLLSGTAHIINQRRAAVEQGDQFEFVEFGNAIVATGSRPLPPDGLALDGERILSPEQALAIERLPRRLAIAGGGCTAVELATAFRRLGVEVSVIVAGERLLPEVEPQLGRAVAQGLRRLGVEVRLNTRVTGSVEGSVQLCRTKGDTAQSTSIDADVLIAAERRAPNTSGLGLEAAGLRLDEDGSIPIDARCRTAVASLWAVGDAVAGLPVAQRAIAQGRVAAEAIAGLAAAYDPSVLPFVCFSDPEVMSAGMSESAARANGFEVTSARFSFGASGRAATLDEQQGYAQVVAERGSGHVLGVHMAGPRVSELAGEAALAIELNATLDDLSLTIHPHPTLSEALPEAAWLALDIPLHIARSR